MKTDCKVNLGFGILTEAKESEYDKKAYESGQITKQHTKQYTKDAIILQSILEHSIDFGIEKSFGSRELSKNYLLLKCDYFVKLYKGFDKRTNTKARAENINDTVVKALEKLVYLELIETKRTEAKNHELTYEYIFTKLGRLIGLLISFKKNKDKVSKDLYEHMLGFYDNMEQSSANFWSIFLRKCINYPNLFDKVILSIIDLLENAPSDNKDSFIKQIKNLNPILTKESWDLILESLSVLDSKDPLKYDRLLYNLKLNLEEIHERKSRYFEGFEEDRFSIRQEPLLAALEGYCRKCGAFTRTIRTIIPYFESYVYSNKGLYVAICGNPNCNINGILDFEFVDEVQYIQERSNVLNKREKKITVKVSESTLYLMDTIFERTDNGKFTHRSKCYQAVLEFLFDNPNSYFKKRDITNNLLKIKPELFRAYPKNR